MEKQTVPEKRKSVRANIKALVIIRCDVLVNINEKERYEFHTHTENISTGGLNVMLEKELHRSDMVEIRLHLIGKSKPIECKGRVAWSIVMSPAGVKPGIFSTGIEFIELKDSDKEAIRKVISCMIERKN